MCDAVLVWSGPGCSGKGLALSRSWLLGAASTTTLKWGAALSCVLPTEESWQLAGAAGRTLRSRSDGSPCLRCAFARALQSESELEVPQFANQTWEVSGKTHCWFKWMSVHSPHTRGASDSQTTKARCSYRLFWSHHGDRELWKPW